MIRCRRPATAIGGRRLLEALATARPPEGGEPLLARLRRRWRLARLTARLDRDWPGGWTAHHSGDLVYVPAPLDAAGRQALLQPPRVHPAVLACLRPGAVVIDIGAGLGAWTLPLARCVGAGGRVLAVEPAPAAAALENTLLANALRQAEVIRCSLGESDAEPPLRSLDSLAAERRLPRLDLVRIAGGGFRRILDGAGEVLDRFRPVLVVETGAEAPSDRPAIHYRLRHLDYRMVGLLLEHGIAEAGWPAYVAGEPPFRAGEPRPLLLLPQQP
jgi:SAM-dependent methyltransferase